jgi:serine-type anaerobic sulfatase-maturating enzyme
VYDFFRGLGVSYLQFLPLVSFVEGGARAAAAPAEAVGAFLCRVFDRWIREDVGRMVIQAFDEALRPIYGIPHALCIHRETCGDVAVLEHDGALYACDHFVDPSHLIGNLAERTLQELVSDPRMSAFGKSKRDTLPAACRECDVLSSCNGGCPKDRPPGLDGTPGLNTLCPAYRMFFHHSQPALKHLARHMKEGRSLRSFRLAP